MNFFVLIMLGLCLLGLVDKILNNKLGLVEAFDRGLNSMGSIAMSMVGFYCIAFPGKIKELFSMSAEFFP